MATARPWVAHTCPYRRRHEPNQMRTACPWELHVLCSEPPSTLAGSVTIPRASRGHCRAWPCCDGRGPARCGTAYWLAVPEVRTKPAWGESAIQSVAGPAADGRGALSPFGVARRFARPTSRPCHPAAPRAAECPRLARGMVTLPRSLPIPDPVFRRGRPRRCLHSAGSDCYNGSRHEGTGGL